VAPDKNKEELFTGTDENPGIWLGDPPDSLAHLDEALVAQKGWVQEDVVDLASGEGVREREWLLVVIEHKFVSKELKPLVKLQQIHLIRWLMGL